MGPTLHIHTLKDNLPVSLPPESALQGCQIGARPALRGAATSEGQDISPALITQKRTDFQPFASGEGKREVRNMYPMHTNSQQTRGKFGFPVLMPLGLVHLQPMYLGSALLCCPSDMQSPLSLVLH